MDSGGEGNTCSSQTGLGYPTDKGEDAGGGQGAQPHQRCSKRLIVTSCGDEERNRAKPHDKVLRSHTRRANSSSGVVGSASQKQVAVVKQRAISVTKRGRDQEWSELRGLVIPSSSSCSPPTNETVELCEQAGLGGTTHAKAVESTTSASTRRTSGARRRSRRGEHCSQPDVTTQSTTNTTITTSNSNNTSASPQVMSSVVGGSEKGRISEECCDEPETMCQEDDAPVPRCHPSASNSPRSFASSIVSEGAAPASARSELGSRHYPNNNNNNPLPREQDAETEETPSMQTVVKVENENWEIVNVKGESFARASVGRKLASKSAHFQSTRQSGGNGSTSRGEFEVIHRAKTNCDRRNVEDGRGDEQRTKEENPEESHPQSIHGDVSMPLLRTDDAGKGATEACVPAPLPSSSTSSFKLSSSSSSTTTTRNLRKTGGASSGQKKHEGHLPPVNKSGCGKSGESELRDKRSASVTEKKKIVTTPAPMLLMNNLPYMGELTFDTRPRRGRKPKKADICHLISKNYGIHFPVSYLNLAAAAAAAPSVPPPALPSHLTSGHGHSTKSSQKRVNNNGNANNASSSSISIVGPSPAPAFCNKDVSIVPIIPSSWSPSSGRAQGKGPISGKNLAKPLSLAQQLSLLRPNSSSQQAISMFPIPNAFPSSSQSRGQLAYKSEEEEAEGDGGGDGLQQNRMDDDGQEDGKGNQDSPLNLCMRDSRFKMITLPLAGSKREVEEGSTLDVRWSKSTRNLEQAQFGSGSFSPTVQLGASKRMVLPPEGEGMVRKACKSAKLSGTQASNTNTNSSYRNSYRSSSSSLSVNNLVRIEPIPSSSFSMPQQRLLDGSAPPYGIPATTSTASNMGGKCGKQHGGSSRKKKELGLRGDIRVSPCNSEASTGGTTSTTGSCGGTAPGAFSSFGGGTLFGQSTSGINEGAEVSICKFKFTGGAKPCLQEKKMLSVDSGGNFRFYTDKSAGGTTSKMGKQQPSTSSSTVTSYSTSVTSGTNPSGGEFSADGTGTECHLPMSSLPKSAKSMSMCMPFAGNTPGVSTITSTATKATTSSSTIASTSLSLPLPISPTVDELQQLHLSINHAGQQNTRESSPYLAGEYSYSSSNSCSSSDNSNENLMQGEGVKMAVSPKSHFNSHPGAYHRHSTGGKLKRKRRTRKSLMREKLEKTFKEKGFLIQTQQLESAEGATYCKFRQLRKFTRYLFRSWKDYLPDHVKEISDKSNNGNSNGGNLPGSSQSTLQSPSTSDGKSGVKEESVEEGQSTSTRIAGNDGEEDEDMDTSDKEETENEDRELGLISKKTTEGGGSASSDEEGDEEDRVVLIEASRAESQESPIPRLTQPHPSLSTGPNEMGDDEASDEDEEELQVDS